MRHPHSVLHTPYYFKAILASHVFTFFFMASGAALCCRVMNPSMFDVNSRVNIISELWFIMIIYYYYYYYSYPVMKHTAEDTESLSSTCYIFSEIMGALEGQQRIFYLQNRKYSSTLLFPHNFKSTVYSYFVTGISLISVLSVIFSTIKVLHLFIMCSQT